MTTGLVRHRLTGLIAATCRFSFWTRHCLKVDPHTAGGLILSFLSAPCSYCDRLQLPRSPRTHSPGLVRVWEQAQSWVRGHGANVATCVSRLLCWPGLRPTLCRFHFCEVQIVPYGIPVYDERGHMPVRTILMKAHEGTAARTVAFPRRWSHTQRIL